MSGEGTLSLMDGLFLVMAQDFDSEHEFFGSGGEHYASCTISSPLAGKSHHEIDPPDVASQARRTCGSWKRPVVS